MATIIINQEQLNNYINDVIANDENLIADMDSVHERVDALLVKIQCWVFDYVFYFELVSDQLDSQLVKKSFRKNNSFFVFNTLSEMNKFIVNLRRDTKK